MPVNRVSFDGEALFVAKDEKIDREIARILLGHGAVELDCGEHDLTPESWLDVYHCTLYVHENGKATFVGLPQNDVEIEKQIHTLPDDKEYTILRAEADTGEARIFEVIYYTDD